MKIIGFTLKKLVVERKEPPKGNLNLQSGLNIDNISAENIDLSKSALRFDFTFTTKYNPDAGEVEIKGSVIVLDEKNESKEILKDWKKKKFEHPSKLALFNFIMNKCNLKALTLEEEVGLPLHLPFPKLAPAPEQKENQSNQNPANYAG